MFDCDTGILRSGSIGPGSLQDLAPDPSGVGQRVRINAKGQIEEIISERVFTAPRHSLAYFRGDSPDYSNLGSIGYYDDNINNVSVEKKPDKQNPTSHISTYEFVVPDYVYRITANIISGGGRRVGNNDGATGAWCQTSLRVEPGESLEIRVGDGAKSDSASAYDTTYLSTVICNIGTYQAGVGHTESLDSNKATTTIVTADANAATSIMLQRPYLPYGQGGTAANPGGYGGIVILEWYA